jgi:hypothetical protein
MLLAFHQPNNTCAEYKKEVLYDETFSNLSRFSTRTTWQRQALLSCQERVLFAALNPKESVPWSDISPPVNMPVFLFNYPAIQLGVMMLVITFS